MSRRSYSGGGRVQIARLRDDGKVTTDEPDKLLEPAKLLPLGHIEIQTLKSFTKGEKPKPVEMKRFQATDQLPPHYTCTCKNYMNRYSSYKKDFRPVEQLSCRHLEKLLGEEYEKERIKNKGRLPGHEETDYKKSQLESSSSKEVKPATPPPTQASASPSPSTSASAIRSLSSSQRIIKTLPKSAPSPLRSDSSSGTQNQASQGTSRANSQTPKGAINSTSIPSFVLENLGWGNNEESKKVIEGIIASNALKFVESSNAFESMELAVKGSITAKRKREQREEPKTNYDTRREPNLGHRIDREGRAMLAVDCKDPAFDPEGWYWNEKLDGVRAIWDGRHFWSRNGNHYAMPRALIDKMPRDVWLDGEFWMERDNFDQLSGICRSDGKSGQWVAKVKFVCFDLIDSQLRFEDRFNQAEDLIGRPKSVDKIIEDETPFGVHMLKTKKIESKNGISAKDKLNEILQSILEKGGEGIMLRRAESRYEADIRSKSLQKIKTFYTAEALLVGYQEGAADGRWVGRVGSLILLMENGKAFTCGSGLKDADHHNPPKIGSIIRYKFQELSRDLTPRFPTFQGVCYDRTAPKDAEVRTQRLRAAQSARKNQEKEAVRFMDVKK